MYMIFEQTISRVISETKAVITHVFSWLIPESIPLKFLKSLPVVEIPLALEIANAVADFARVDG